jgi:hypothetical protein
MPRIFVDGQEHMGSNRFGEITIGELLSDFMTSLAGSQKMVCAVDIDGVPLTEESLPHVAQRQTAGVGTVALRTMTHGELTRFGLQRAVLLADDVIRQAALSAEYFRTAPREAANRLYAACLDDLQLLVDVVDQTLRLQDGAPQTAGQPAQPALPRLLPQLAAVTGELLLAYRRDDVMVVADLLTYELVPLLKDIHQGLETSLARMEVE